MGWDASNGGREQQRQAVGGGGEARVPRELPGLQDRAAQEHPSTGSLQAPLLRLDHRPLRRFSSLVTSLFDQLIGWEAFLGLIAFFFGWGSVIWTCYALLLVVFSEFTPSM